MAKFYVLSHNTGKFILDGDFSILERISNVEDSILSYCFSKHDDVYLLNDFDLLRNSLVSNTLEGEPLVVKENQDYSKLSKAIISIEKMITTQDYYNKIRSENIIRTSKLIKDSVQKDTLLIQAINSIDEINKSSNLLSKRIREWYSLYFPEISKKINDHEKYVRTISSKSREVLLSELEITDTMGANISEEDVIEIIEMSKTISSLYSLRERYELYIKKTILEICPNASYVLSEMICARLISCAGSFNKLSSYPASTIQLLGAEKALFRFLRDKKHKSPKYGILYQHPLMSKFPAKKRGKFARILGNYATIAFKIDKNNPNFDYEKIKIITKGLKKFLNDNKVVPDFEM